VIVKLLKDVALVPFNRYPIALKIHCK